MWISGRDGKSGRKVVEDIQAAVKGNGGDMDVKSLEMDLGDSESVKRAAK